MNSQDPLHDPLTALVDAADEFHRVAALHDVAAAFARCARACRDGRSTVTPVIARRMHADDEMEWFGSRRSPTERVA
jgi:hypothetical protein